MEKNVPRDLILACVRLAQRVREEDEMGDTTDRSRKANEKKTALQALLNLENQSHVSWDDVGDLLWTLYARSPMHSTARQQIVHMLLDLAQRQDLPFYHAVEAAHRLYKMSPKGSQEKQQAAQMLLTQACWPTITMKQSVEAVTALCFASPLRSKEREQGIEVLSALAQRPNISVEDAWVFITLDFDFAPITIIDATPSSARRQVALRKNMLEALAQHSDLTAQQEAYIAEALSALSGPLQQARYHTTR